MGLYQKANRTELSIAQTVILGQLNRGFKPEHGLTICTVYMYMHAGLFTREKVKSKAVFSKNGWAHPSYVNAASIRRQTGPIQY
jgi:hypothetical protein